MSGNKGHLKSWWVTYIRISLSHTPSSTQRQPTGRPSMTRTEREREMKTLQQRLYAAFCSHRLQNTQKQTSQLQTVFSGVDFLIFYVHYMVKSMWTAPLCAPIQLHVFPSLVWKNLDICWAVHILLAMWCNMGFNKSFSESARIFSELPKLQSESVHCFASSK